MNEGALEPSPQPAISISGVESELEKLASDSGQPQKSGEIDYLQLLAEAEVDPTGAELPPQVVISIEQLTESSAVGTLGNFTAIIGKAKAKKTFFVVSYVAAAIKNEKVLLVRGNLPANQRKVLYFDTEQSRYHVQKAARRIIGLAGAENIHHLRIYALRKHTPDIRLKAIEAAIYQFSDVGMVVIDGVRDMVFDINDSEQAVKTVNHLMKWTEERNLHLLTVLHQNKGDANARGHLGTEVVNKAETVIGVTKNSKNKEESIVSPEYCRDKEFEPFAFFINDLGLPELVEVNWSAAIEAFDTIQSELTSPEELPKPNGKTPESFDMGTHIAIMERAFSKKPVGYQNTVLNIQEALGYLGYKIGVTACRSFLAFYTQRDYVLHDEKKNRPVYRIIQDKVDQAKADLNN